MAVGENLSPESPVTLYKTENRGDRGQAQQFYNFHMAALWTQVMLT